MVVETAYIGVGTNLGNKRDNIKRAITMLDEIKQILVTAVAPVYRTAPVGYTEQDYFLNTVVQVETYLSPRELLAKMLGIEDKMGRKRTIRWGPRVIDLDLLLYGDKEVKEKDLIVPHPRLTKRAFVAVPLADLAPDLKLPGGKSAVQVAADLKGEQQVERLDFQVRLNIINAES